VTPPPAALAWLELLAFAEPDDLRSWLDERGAFELHGRGVRDLGDSAALPVIAGVLADLLGHPSDVIEGELLA
jgi:hypothetical protein